MALVFAFFLLAGLLSVRYAPVSEGTKACKEAKAKQGNQTKPSKNQNTNKKTTKPNKKNTWPSSSPSFGPQPLLCPCQQGWQAESGDFWLHSLRGLSCQGWLDNFWTEHKLSHDVYLELVPWLLRQTPRLKKRLDYNVRPAPLNTASHTPPPIVVSL